MIVLSRTRGFSAGNWQILLTNNNLNAAGLIGVYMALTFFRDEADSTFLAKLILYRTG